MTNFNDGQMGRDDGMESHHSDNGDMTDILLMEEETSEPEVKKEDEIIYELVVEDKKDTPADDDLSLKIKALEDEQQALQNQVEVAINKSYRLAAQVDNLKRSKRVITLGYTAIAIAVIAFVIATLSFVMNSSQDEFYSNPEQHGQAVDTTHVELDNTINELLMAEEASASEDALITPADEAETVSTPDESAAATLDDESAITADETLVTESATLIAKPVVEEIEKNDTDHQISTSDEASQLEKALGIAKKVNPVVKKNIKTTAQTKPQAPQKQGWVVGLGSFKNEAIAKQTASKYRRAGVPVAVMPVTVKGQAWHRISTHHFKTHQEAVEYAEKAKKTLKIKAALIAKVQS